MCERVIWKCSYKILAPQAVDKESDPKKIAQVILEATGLDVESYRLGHTKACHGTSTVVRCLI